MVGPEGQKDFFVHGPSENLPLSAMYFSVDIVCRLSGDDISRCPLWVSHEWPTKSPPALRGDLRFMGRCG